MFVPDQIVFSKLTRGDIVTALKVAKLMASRSKANRLKVGAVVLHPRNRGIISTGYNGTIEGSDNNCEENGVTRPGVIHAERNALKKMNWFRRFGKVIVVTHAPCVECAKMIIVAGVAAVFYETEYRSPEGLDLLRRSGVSLFKIKR